ncbi:hypothetical protein D932_02118 [Enterococcus casseliflavus 14-MB-W-14]|uniref:hypothetical protein n=1 Tax=Enterococcus casseliflavus TaxID=37734 RepID=UPI0003537F59|nr:hypothetical protein [Enterococcus casseliflavus]EPH63096.1 hypothetical protein D932_02118 [Enterococcus casseliflavus 14-MB-W-14]
MESKFAEEKLRYIVQLEDKYLAKIYDSQGNYKLVDEAMLTELELVQYQLTEAEIKSYDDRYWSFSIPTVSLEPYKNLPF